jgi:hypothetical protein
MQKDLIKTKYLNAAEEYRLIGTKEDKTLLFLSVLRFIFFFGGLILIWFAFTQSIQAGILITIFFITLFLYLLKLFSNHSATKVLMNNHLVINKNEADAISGNLSAFHTGNSFADPGHDFSSDVDLFGNSSLFQNLNRTVTGYGRDILAGWLSDPYSLSPELTLRQDVIRELAKKEKWRHDFMASGMEKSLETSQISGTLKWMAESSQIKSSRVKKIRNHSLSDASYCRNYFISVFYLFLSA